MEFRAFPDAGRVGRVPYRMISKRRNLLTNEIDSVTVVTSMRGLRGDLLRRLAAWRGARRGPVSVGLRDQEDSGLSTGSYKPVLSLYSVFESFYAPSP